jgi:hypothetical protein
VVPLAIAGSFIPGGFVFNHSAINKIKGRCLLGSQGQEGKKKKGRNEGAA